MIIIITITILLGIAMGSFINAYDWRTEQSLKPKRKNAKQYSILTGRSVCPKCKHVLGGLDLIPIFSWLFLRGKCRYCKKSISVQYPLVEAITLILFILSYVVWPIPLSTPVEIALYVAWLSALVVLVALSLYDIKRMLLPNKMIYQLLIFSLVIVYLNLMKNGYSWHNLLGPGFGLVVGGGIFYVIYQISQGKWIGGGDVKLGAVLGILLGSASFSFMMIFLSSVLALVVSLPLVMSGKTNRKTLIPYGPFLIAATYIIFLFGGRIIVLLNGRGIYF